MNKNFHLVSDLLRGQWLIHEEWANAHLPLVAKILNGEPLDASFTGLTSEAPVDDPTVYKVYDGVAMISIDGPLTKWGGMCSYGTMDYISLLQTAYSDESIRGVVIRIDSPGGSIAGIDTFHSLVADRNKPTVAIIEDLAASAGYYAVSGCDYILLSSRTSMAGCIGVMTTIRDYSARLEAMGVKERAIYSRLSPDKNNETRALEEGDDGPMLDQLDKIATIFHGRVIEGRGDKLKRDGIDPLDGGTFIGQDAINNGLADEFGDLETAFEKVIELSSNNGRVNFSITNNVNMFGDKYPKLTALRGVAAAAITETMLEEANAQLAERDISGVVLVNQAWVTDAEGLQTQLNTQTAEATRLSGLVSAGTTKATELQARIDTLQAERDTFEAKALEFGYKPATDPAKPEKKEEKIEGSVEQSKNPYLCQADIEAAALRQRAQLN